MLIETAVMDRFPIGYTAVAGILAGMLMAAASAHALQAPLDYGQGVNWACHPMKASDISRQPLRLTVVRPDLSVDSVIQYAQPAKQTGVDIFYVYPTLDLNLYPGFTAAEKIDTASVQKTFRQQAGLYAQFGRVYAPYYRQVNLGVYAFAGAKDQADLFDSAYQDVERAFRHYLAHDNQGNKIILIGHSQGSEHVVFLLRKMFDNDPALRAKLLVAIAGGSDTWVPPGKRSGGLLENVPLCPSRDSGLVPGCVISWRTYKAGTALARPGSTRPCYNPFLVGKGQFFRAFDTLAFQEKQYDFGYRAAKTLKRYIMADPKTPVNFVAYDGMYSADFLEQPAPPAVGLMIKNIQAPGDARVDPMANGGSNYHIYDMQIVQGDLLDIVKEMIARFGPAGAIHIATPRTGVFAGKAFRSDGRFVKTRTRAGNRSGNL